MDFFKKTVREIGDEIIAEDDLYKGMNLDDVFLDKIDSNLFPAGIDSSLLELEKSGQILEIAGLVNKIKTKIIMTIVNDDKVQSLFFVLTYPEMIKDESLSERVKQVKLLSSLRDKINEYHKEIRNQ